MKKTYEIINKNNKNIIEKEILPSTSNLSFYTKSIIEIIEESYRTKLQMQDCVERLKVSATLLNNKFKNEVGLTFNDYLNRYRIQVSIKLLKENKMPIYKIAEETGFRDYKYFSKVFNKYVGCSPSEYMNIVEF